MHQNLAPDGTKLPYIVLRLVPPGSVTGTMSNDHNIVVVDFMIFCDDFDVDGNALLETQGYPIRDAIIALYDNHYPAFSGGHVIGVYRESAGVAQPEPDRGWQIPVSYRYELTE
jgi:hypothetical protein